MAILDWTFFPHLLDAVIVAALDSKDHGLIRTLRLTHRYVRDTVDRRIAEHAVLIARTGRPTTLLTAVGQVRLAFHDPDVAAHVRAFDMYSDDWASFISTYQPIAFPNVRCVQTFADGDPRPWDAGYAELAEE